MTQTSDPTFELLTPQFIARLDQLDILSRKLLAGKLRGERRSKRLGQSVEFADFRNYSVGDDLRFIDWNIYARLEKLLLKLFLEEEDLAVYLLLDVSSSLDYGNPNKIHYLKQVAAALGYIGLINFNRVTVVGMSQDLVAQGGPMRSRRNVSRLMEFITNLKPAGSGHFTQACRHFALAHRPKGVLIVLSDFFVKEGFQEGLKYLASGRYDLFCIQCLSPQEIDPDLQGDLKLRDMEDGDTTEVSITQPLLKKYRANLDTYCQSLKTYLIQRGATYLRTSTAVPFDRLILTYLRHRGLLG
ncbi:MAG: DUF58 domain-containing protein [Phycisphaerales bacterium]|nr:DUF58 domain-containing protein [Phycisphaerales bacterium]